MDTKIVILGVVAFLVLVYFFRKSIKKAWFRIPGLFEGGIETEENIAGGRGGNAKVVGSNSAAIGGKGGGGGPGGRGGDGGNVEVSGDNTLAMGGEGGEAGQADRGGRGGRSPLEVLGYPNTELPDGTHLWDYGKGGDGANPSDKSGND